MNRLVPKLSICIPTYNQTFYLKKVLDSVFEQTFTDFEVIISDDSTTDDVRQLLNSYEQFFDKIEYYHHRIPLGSPENWNFAIRKAKGDFIKILHHDDWLIRPDSLQKFIDKTNGIKYPFIFSAGQSIANGKMSIHKPSHAIVKNFNKRPLDLMSGNLIGGPSSILFPNHCGLFFDVNLTWLVDIDFYITLLSKGFKLIYIDEVLYASVIDSHNITNSCIDNFPLQQFEYSTLYIKHTDKKKIRLKLKYFFKTFFILNKRKKIKLLYYYNYIKKVKNMINDEKYLATPIEIEHELVDFFNTSGKLIFFDIGSCDGLDAVKYSRLFKESKVFAFEPLSKNFNLISENIRKYHCDNIIPVQVAMSDKNGEAEFFVSSGTPEDEVENSEWDYGNKSSSLLAPEKTLDIHPWLKFENKETVKTITLNEFCNENKIDVIDFIHMDVQGAEIMVLNGADKFMTKIKMIWLEVENVELYKNQPLKNDIEDFMLKYGFTKIKDTVNHVAGDQLWVNLDYFPKKKLTNKIWKMYSRIFNKK